MWSPLRAWLLGVRDPFLDKDVLNVVNAEPRATKIDEEFLDRIAAFRGRVPDTNAGATSCCEVHYDHKNAANDCLSECENDKVALRFFAIGFDETDTEPLNFVSTAADLAYRATRTLGHRRVATAFSHTCQKQYNIMQCAHDDDQTDGHYDSRFCTKRFK